MSLKNMPRSVRMIIARENQVTSEKSRNTPNSHSDISLSFKNRKNEMSVRVDAPRPIAIARAYRTRRTWLASARNAINPALAPAADEIKITVESMADVRHHVHHSRSVNA